MQTVDSFLEAKSALVTLQEYPRLKYRSLSTSTLPAGVCLDVDGNMIHGTAFPGVQIDVAEG